MFKQFDIVKVPFPFTDAAIYKPRPALVLSCDRQAQQTSTLTVCMITTATNSSWPSDIAIENFKAAGLKKACVCRLKLATLDPSMIEEKIGVLPADLHQAVISGFISIVGERQ